MKIYISFIPLVGMGNTACMAFTGVCNSMIQSVRTSNTAHMLFDATHNWHSQKAIRIQLKNILSSFYKRKNVCSSYLLGVAITMTMQM
jgi:hypothetical protein